MSMSYIKKIVFPKLGNKKSNFDDQNFIRKGREKSKKKMNQVFNINIYLFTLSKNLIFNRFTK
jgi:hypothetical protein